MILESMVLKSVWALAAVNRHLLASVCSLPVIRAAQESYTGAYALRRLIQADAGNAFTLVDFKIAFQSKACATCRLEREFAPLLNLAKCERICLRCFRGSRREHERQPMQLVRLSYLKFSNGAVQIQRGRLCEGCARDSARSHFSDFTAQARAEKVFLEDQFLEHFSTCETAQKIAAGQRMCSSEEFRLCADLRQWQEKVWGSTIRKTPPARSFRAAWRKLKYGEELTPPAFRAEYERLKEILEAVEGERNWASSEGSESSEILDYRRSISRSDDDGE